MLYFCLRVHQNELDGPLPRAIAGLKGSGERKGEGTRKDPQCLKCVDAPAIYPVATLLRKPCPHCRRKVRLSQKMANSATVAVFGDSRTFCDSVDRALQMNVVSLKYDRSMTHEHLRRFLQHLSINRKFVPLVTLVMCMRQTKCAVCACEKCFILSSWLSSYRAMHYSAKLRIAIVCRPSVRPSVCLSVCDVGG